MSRPDAGPYIGIGRPDGIWYILFCEVYTDFGFGKL